MLAGVIDEWNQVRKKARVLLVIDVSGSMGDEADPSTGATKLDLAKKAAIAALDQFQPDDEVGLRVFSTDISPDEPTDYLDVVPIGPMSDNRDALESNIRSLVPDTGHAALHGRGRLVPEDGRRVRPDAASTRSCCSPTVATRTTAQRRPRRVCSSSCAGAERGRERPHRCASSPIAYGSDADEATLKRIAEATNAAAYSAVDPATIVNVFNAVVSNF